MTDEEQILDVLRENISVSSRERAKVVGRLMAEHGKVTVERVIREEIARLGKTP